MAPYVCINDKLCQERKTHLLKGNKHVAISNKMLKIFSISYFILVYSSLTRVGLRCSPCLSMSNPYLILPWIEFRKRITPMPCECPTGPCQSKLTSSGQLGLPD